MNTCAKGSCPKSKRLVRYCCATVLVLIAWSALPQPVTAQGGALSAEDTIRAREFALGSRILFSPDGKWVAYTIIRSHAEDGDMARRTAVPSFVRGADVYIANLATFEERLITQGAFDNWEPAWSPNSQYLAFLSDRDGSGKPKVWVWNSNDNLLRKISDAQAGLHPLQWTPDGRQIISSSATQPTEATGYSSDGEVSALALQRRSTVKVYEGTVQPDAAPWSLAVYSTSLELMDIDTGKTKTLARGQIGTYKLSPDGSHLAFTIAKAFEKPAVQQILFDFTVLDMKSSESQVAVSNVRLSFDGSGFSWSPDGTRLCLRTEGEDQEPPSYRTVSVEGKPLHQLTVPYVGPDSNSRETPLWDESGRSVYFIENGELWRGEVASGRTERVTQVTGRRITQIIPKTGSVLWFRDASSAVVVTHDDEGKQDGIYSINVVNGESNKLMEHGQCYTCVLDEPAIATSMDGQKVAFVAEDAVHSADLWISDAEFKSPGQLTRINPFFDPSLMGEARLIDWLSDDGKRLKGVLLLPAGYRPEKRYPLVTYVYGGGLLSNRFDRFGLANPGPLNMQLLASRGYAVFLPDTPLNPGTPMLSLAKTVLPGINKVLELGFADPDRLAVMGHSYGGYSVLSLIVQTNRFKAAVVMAGDGDLFGLYGEMRSDGTAYGVALTEHGQALIGGTPWDHRDGFIENSPFFYYDRIQTPVLIIQGSDDPAVGAFLADQSFVALRRLGKEVEYAKYSGEGHSPAQEWSYANQMDLFSRMIRWLDTHLKRPPEG